MNDDQRSLIASPGRGKKGWEQAARPVRNREALVTGVT